MASFAPSVTARMEMAMVRELTSSFHALAILPKESMSFAQHRPELCPPMKTSGR